MQTEPIKNGAFIIARKLFDSEIWLSKPSSWKVIWIYILGNVAHEDKGQFKRGVGFFTFSKSLNEIGVDISQDMVKKSISFFKKSGMISTRRSTRGMYIEVLKYKDYQTLDNYKSTRESTNEAPEKHQESTPIHKKLRSKEDKNTNGITSDVPSQEIVELIESFKEVNPMYSKWFANKTQRDACERLIKINGLDRLKKIVAFLPKSNSTEYMPVVTSPLQLEDKFGQLASSWQKLKNKEPLII